MKPFSLEEYLKNPDRKVVTRDGKKVRIICTDRKSHGGYYPIIALVKPDKDEEIVNSYTIDGNWYGGGFKNKLDLFFAPEKHEGWVNILNCPNGNFISHTRIFKSKKNAEKVGKNFGSYLTTIKIEWEE